ncbi:hypothetical protein DFH29DRAFT_246964 [Suillus ampliporus]|nr:hypothetical protein DFH29DRAFT_246964 [Suillus ampliporus]
MTSSSSMVATSGEMTRKTGFLSLPEELRLHTLNFLPSQDILRCTSVCKDLRKTYLSSSSLQYIVELGGQGLLPIPKPDDSTPMDERLRVLRDKAHAWWKFDIDSFETFPLPESIAYSAASVAYGHLCVWNDFSDTVSIAPILPNPSQQVIECDWSIRSLCSSPYPAVSDVFMDPPQNLLAIAYLVPVVGLRNKTLCIDIRALDSSCVHPKAAGLTVFPSQLVGYEDSYIETKLEKLKGFGSHIALWRCLGVGRAGTPYENVWELQVWDWQHSTTPSSVLHDTFHLRHPRCLLPDLCFLGNNRFLIIANDSLRLYSIPDMSQPPQLLACFLMPSPIWYLRFLPMDDTAHIAQLGVQTTHISDPQHQVLCLTNFEDLAVIISTNIFFDLDGMDTTAPIPWQSWGPLNTRIFAQATTSRMHISGNRVLLASPMYYKSYARSNALGHILQMMDFSPLAVTNRRGLGRVVDEPSTMHFAEESLTTSLSYVEVVLDRELRDLKRLWIDQDRIYLQKDVRDHRGNLVSTFLSVITPYRLE